MRPAVSRRERGQAMVEFALVLPIFLLVLLGVFDFGRAIYAYNAVANAAREGARTAIINQGTDTIRAKAAQQATALGLPATDPGAACPLDGGPTTAASGICVHFFLGDSTVTCDPIAIECNAVVSVKWEYRAIVPLVGNVVGAIPLVATSRQAIENVCPRAGVTTCLGR